MASDPSHSDDTASRVGRSGSCSGKSGDRGASNPGDDFTGADGADRARDASIDEEPLSELIAQEERRHDPYAAVREANYRFFASGWLLASTGMRMQEAAVLWEIAERTKDPLMVGLAGLARALPVVLLALPAGQIIDLVDRKRVLVVTHAAFALAATALAIASANHASIAWIYVLLVVNGCARVFSGPSRASILPQLVRPESFHNAVTWNSGIFHFSAMIGPIAAGIMIAQSGHVYGVYATCSLLCLIMVALAMCVRPRPLEHAPERKRIWEAIRPGVLLPGILEGARHIRRERTVLAAIALDLMAVLFGGATALLPLYATDILKVGAVEYGALKAAQFVGALIMSIALAHRPPFRRAGWTLLLCVAGYGVGTIVFGLSVNLYLSLAVLLAIGALDAVSVVIRHVLVTVRTPDHLRGRVSAVNSVFIESSNELGNFEAGAAARLGDVWLGLGKAGGAVFSVVSGGVGTLLVVAFVAWKWPQLRNLRQLNEGEGSRES